MQQQQQVQQQQQQPAANLQEGGVAAKQVVLPKAPPAGMRVSPEEQEKRQQQAAARAQIEEEAKARFAALGAAYVVRAEQLASGLAPEVLEEGAEGAQRSAAWRLFEAMSTRAYSRMAPNFQESYVQMDFEARSQCVQRHIGELPAPEEYMSVRMEEFVQACQRLDARETAIDRANEFAAGGAAAAAAGQRL